MKTRREIPRDVYSWFDANRDNGYLKILAGVRGAGKTHVLKRIREKLQAEGVPVVFVDFEAPENRGIKTCREALRMMDLDRYGGVKHVFLDEVGYLPDFRKLLGVIFADKECRVLISTSNARVLQEDCLGYFSGCHTRFDLFPDPERKRTGAELEGIWNKAFVRDVLGGNTLADAYAAERIAEYLSDTAGELVSSRRVAEEVTFAGRKLAHVTAGQYMQHLEDAFIVEKIPVWDALSGEASTRRFAYYFTDAELREHFFHSEGEGARRRTAITATYAALRRELKCPVYAVRADDAEADFATVEGAVTHFWRAEREADAGVYAEVRGKVRQDSKPENTTGGADEGQDTGSR